MDPVNPLILFLDPQVENQNFKLLFIDSDFLPGRETNLLDPLALEGSNFRVLFLNSDFMHGRGTDSMDPLDLLDLEGSNFSS